MTGSCVAFVDDLRGSGPTLIVVEDAHWADEATIEALAMLGRRAVDLPVLLVVTYRENEVTADHPLRMVLGDLATSAGSAWLASAPLSLEAIRALAAPEGASPEELYQRTGGNPFYVTEALAEPGTAVPTTVRLAVLARASRLTPSARCRRRRGVGGSGTGRDVAHRRDVRSVVRRRRSLRRSWCARRQRGDIRVPARGRPIGRRGRARRTDSGASSTAASSPR